jgi:hypothetical protein
VLLLPHCLPNRMLCLLNAFLQVHDINGQLEAALHLLQHTAVFTSIVTSQDDMLRGSKLYNIYAVRR